MGCRAEVVVVNEHLSSLRIEYETAGLEPESMAADPMVQWQRWFDDALAAKLHEPHAVIVSTVDHDGMPDSRYVLVRGADDGGLSFFTNYASEKASHLARNPGGAMTFGWLELHRQVRVRGTIEVLNPDDSDAYWQSRPRDSQLASASSPQSQIIPDRLTLERLVDATAHRWADQPSVPRPAHWGGYRLVPSTVEFWQGRPARLHDRLRYRRLGDDWVIERLAP